MCCWTNLNYGNQSHLASEFASTPYTKATQLRSRSVQLENFIICKGPEKKFEAGLIIAKKQ